MAAPNSEIQTDPKSDLVNYNPLMRSIVKWTVYNDWPDNLLKIKHWQLATG